VKSLSDIKQDMSSLYDELRDGKVELKLASELANIAGKNLKAEQLDLARAIFLSGSGAPVAAEEKPEFIETGVHFWPAVPAVEPKGKNAKKASQGERSD
jgi:hypothetical protein